MGRRINLVTTAPIIATSWSLGPGSAQASSGTAPQCVGKGETYVVAYATRVPFSSSPIRCGSGADHNYGWNKIYAKHGIHLFSVVQGTVANGADASTGSDQAMGRAVYRRRFIQGAAPYNSIVVRAVVDRTVTVNGVVLGVNTTYCEGVTVCPTWINSSTTQSQPVAPR